MKNPLKALWAARQALLIDAEYRDLIESHNSVRADAAKIKAFLMKVAQENLDGVEKFNDEILQEAQQVLDQCGPGAFYWMADIAAELAKLAQYSMAGLETNISQHCGGQADAVQIIDAVVVV